MYIDIYKATSRSKNYLILPRSDLFRCQGTLIFLKSFLSSKRAINHRHSNVERDS